MWDEEIIAQATREADRDRTKRAFIGFLSTALGVDQTPVAQDGVMARPTGQFTIANPDGTYSIQGQARSNVQGVIAGPAGITITPGLLLLAGAAFMLLRR